MLSSVSRVLLGRRIIKTEFGEITRANVVDVLKKAFTVHLRNKIDIEYLYRYYCGFQPILYREKEVRPEINNKIVENRALEIVAFRVGYNMGEPVQYVSRGDDKRVAQGVSQLNDYVTSEEKEAEDRLLCEWAQICGTSFRMVLPDAQVHEDKDEAPFEIFTLDPRYTFVVYQNALGTPPVMAVTYIEKSKSRRVFSVYTKNWYYEIEDYKIVRDEPQYLGIPIIEYPLNNSRLGAFEPVIPILDAINVVASDRINGIMQFIQALMLFHNVEIDESEFALLRQEGALQYRDVSDTMKGEIKYLVQELNQMQTQTLVDHMYNSVLTIVGMPNRNGGTSTSDTGTAVIMRDGWSAAEARAKDYEITFKKSEMKFLKLVLKICRGLSDLDLKASAVQIRFTRRNYENISEKANVLVTMLNNPKIAPQLAFTHCGMFSDPHVAYMASVEYQQKSAAEGQPHGANDKEELNGETGEADKAS